MLLCREGAVLHFLNISLEARRHSFTDIRKRLDKFRCKVGKHGQHILIDEHLSVAVRTCADADGRDVQLLCDLLCQRCRYTLQYYGERACLLYAACIVENLLCRSLALALYAEAAKRIDRLRCHTDMGADRNGRVDNRANLFADRGAALELDSLCAAFLHQTAGVDQGVIGGCLIGHERHIRNEQRIFRAASNCRRMMDHILHCDGQRILITKADHAQRIAD